MSASRDEHATTALILSSLHHPETLAALAARISQIVEGEVFGRRMDSFDIDKLAWLAAGLSSADYALANMAEAQRCEGAHPLLSLALSRVQLDGLFLEFGVFSGFSITHMAQLRPDTVFHGFDSFEGLPETWRQGFEKGAFARDGLPPVPANVQLIKGWFDHTLPAFCAAHAGETAAFIHVDCDLYSSTQTLFAQLKTFIRPGTIIVFDEYFNYPGWQAHEFRAFQEFCASARIAYRYIGLVAHHQQAAVEILAVR